jgi:imidazolonepropionase-like amidohydrolase
MQGAAPLNNGAKAMRSGNILDVGPAGRVIAKHPGHRVVHLNNSVLLPGLVNLHCHLALPSAESRMSDKTENDSVSSTMDQENRGEYPG